MKNTRGCINTRTTKLYNVLFPVWMLLFFPQMWLFVLPGNLLIDSLVLFILLLIFKLDNKKQIYKDYIFKVFLFGLLSDVLGSIYMLVLMIGLDIGNMGDEIYLTLPALIISSIFIFVLNYFFTFKHLQKRTKLIFSLIFATFTAPYTFLFPSSWLYGWYKSTTSNVVLFMF